MAQEPTCGQGLAEHAVLPAALADLTGALADNLEMHMHALDLSDAAARAEHDVWGALVARQRQIAAQLRDAGAAMGAHADLPKGRHDPEALASPQVRDAFERLIAAERALVEVLRERIERHERMLADELAAGGLRASRAGRATAGHHLRPIRASDVEIDYPAVMGSRERLWAKYGDAWGWPPATMTVEQDREDLARHEAEIAAHETFDYAVLDEGETALLGCVYIDPPEPESPRGTDAVASWVGGRRGGRRRARAGARRLRAALAGGNLGLRGRPLLPLKPPASSGGHLGLLWRLPWHRPATKRLLRIPLQQPYRPEVRRPSRKWTGVRLAGVLKGEIAPRIEPGQPPRVDPGDWPGGGVVVMKRWMRGGAFLAVAGGAVGLLPAVAYAQVPTSVEYSSTDSPNTWLRVGGTGDAVIAEGGTVTFTVPAGGSPNHNLDFDLPEDVDPTCVRNGAPTSLPTPLGRGWTATCTFPRPDTYRFICVPHQGSMNGRITVQPVTPTPPGGADPGAPQPGGGTPPPPAGPTQPGGTTTPALAATSLKLAKRQTGSRLRGSVDVRERGSRLRVDARVRRTLLGQRRRSGRVRVGRLVRSSVGPGRVAFSLGLQARARKALRGRRSLAVQLRITVTGPGATERTWTRSVTLAVR